MTALKHYSQPLDPTRLDLAREFRADPMGLRSPELAVLLNRMRSLPLDGKHLLIETLRGEEWTLARMWGTPPQRIEILSETVFHAFEDAEWFVFKLRWEALCGEPLLLPEEGGAS